MFVLVVGGGRVGSHLAGLLLQEGHELKVVENRPEILERLRPELPPEALCEGEMSSPTVLEAAGIKRANVLAAVTGEDEVNLVVASLARFEFNVPRVIARVNDPSNAWMFTAQMGVDVVVDEYIPVLDELAESISDIEAEVLERPEPDVLSRIFHLKRQLIEFRRMAGGMRDVVNAIMRREHGLIGDDLDPYFRHIYDHLVRTVELIETYRDLLTGSLDIYLSAIANRTNEVMKVLTIYGTVALPLVIITGFFGMNLHLPWMQHSGGALYVCGLMAASAAAVLAYFKYSGSLGAAAGTGAAQFNAPQTDLLLVTSRAERSSLLLSSRST